MVASLTGTADAQPAVEAVVPRTVLKSRIVPGVIRKFAPLIKEKMKEKLAEINQGFKREQILEVSLFDLIEDQQDEIEKTLKKFSSNPAEWELFMDRLRFMKIQAAFNLQISPEAERFGLKFDQATQDRGLASFQGTLNAKPIIELKEITSLKLVETDPETGEERKVDFPPELLTALASKVKFQMPLTRFSMSGILAENLRAPKPDEKPKDPLSIEIQSWESTFKDVVLPEAEAESVLQTAFRGENFFALSRTLMKTRAFRDVIPRIDEPKRALLERDVKNYLDKQTTDIVLWIERLNDGSLKPHLSAATKPSTIERIEKARREGRLFLEATSTIPLRSKDLKIRYDEESQIATAEFVPEEIFSPKFRVKSFYLPKSWKADVSDPLLKQVIEVLYKGNLAEGREIDLSAVVKVPSGSAKLEIPVDWQDDAPHWKSDAVQLSMSLLDQAIVESAQMRWSADEKVDLDFISGEPLKNQFLRQLRPILRAHEEILGAEFFENARSVLFKKAEDEILSFQGTETKTVEHKVNGYVFPASPGFNFKVTDFALVREGKLKCSYSDSPEKQEFKDLSKIMFLMPQERGGVPFDLVNQKGLLDLDCELQLPRKVGIDLTNVDSEEGKVSSIKFALKTPDDQPNPTIKMRWRLVRDPQTKILMALPVEMNLDDALAKYDIPTTGEGKPQIGYVEASGVKGFVADTVRVGGFIWNYWLGPKTRSVMQTDEGFVAHLGITAATIAAEGTVRKAEVEAVEEALRKSVAKTKAQMKERLTRAIYQQLNGNVAERRALAIQMRRWGAAFDEKENKIIRDFYDKNIVRDYNLDPQKVDQGLLGMAENRVSQMLRRFQEAAPVGKPLGAFPVGGNQTLRQLVEEEGRQTTRETLEGDPAGLNELSFMSNPELKKQVTGVRDRVKNFLQTSIGRKWKQIEDAVVNFIRLRSDPKEPSPQESVQLYLNAALMKAVTDRTSVSTNSLHFPEFCGVSVVSSQVQEAQDLVYSIIPNVATDVGPPPFLRDSRPGGSPRLEDLLKTVGQDGAIPLGVSTTFLEAVANDPQNLRAIEKSIVDEARKFDGISDKFTVDIRQVKIRLTEQGEPVIRVKVKIDQPAEGLKKVFSVVGILPDLILSKITGEKIDAFQNLAGLPGWLGDQLTSGIQIIDGYMDFEIPFHASVGDVTSAQTGDVIGHYLHLWPEARGFKVRHEKGWKSLVGDVARSKLEDNIKTFEHTIEIPQPLSIPGFEDEFYFKLGKEMNEDLGRKTILPLPTVRSADCDKENLYEGTFQIRGRLQVRHEDQGYPSLEVSRAP